MAADLQASTEDIMPTEHFRLKEAYRKNLAYRHIHGIPMNAKEVVVGKKKHTVKHRGKKKVQRKKAKRKRS